MTPSGRRPPTWRLLAAAVALGLCWAVPAPVEFAGGTEAWTRAAVRRWLLGAESPLAACVRDGRLGPVHVELRISPPMTDETTVKRTAAEYAACAPQWVLAEPPGRRPTFDPAAPASVLLVRVGERGARAEFTRPDGTSSQYEIPFPTRWSLLPAFAAVALALLIGGLPAALAAGAAAALVATIVFWPVL